MLTSMPTFVQVIEFVGTFAFAISGIRLASAKQFDWFGAYVVGLATAIGGGTIRDLLLGHVIVYPQVFQSLKSQHRHPLVDNVTNRWHNNSCHATKR